MDGKRVCCSVKCIETVTVSFSVKVQKQVLSLGVHTVAGVQTGNSRFIFTEKSHLTHITFMFVKA